MLNSADYNSFSDLVSVYLKVLTIILGSFNNFGGIQQVLNSDFLKFRILEILNFYPCWYVNSFPASGKKFHLLVTFTNSLDPDQAQQNVHLIRPLVKSV